MNTPLQGLPLNPEYTLENYCISEENLIPYHAVQLSTTQNAYLFGKRATGKSHLLHAAGAQFQREGKNVVLINGTTTNLTINKKEIDALLIDDLHALSGNDTTERSLQMAELIAQTIAYRKPIVITARASQHELSYHEALLQQLEGIPQYKLKPPTNDERINIVANIAQRYSINLPPLLAVSLARHARIDTRYDAVLKTFAAYISAGKEASIATLNEIIVAHHGKIVKRSSLQIAQLVAQYHDISLENLRSKTNAWYISHPRQIAMYLMYQHTESSQPEIGTFFGKNHTTVTHGIQKITRELETDGTLRNTIKVLSDQLQA